MIGSINEEKYIIYFIFYYSTRICIWFRAACSISREAPKGDLTKSLRYSSTRRARVLRRTSGWQWKAFWGLRTASKEWIAPINPCIRWEQNGNFSRSRKSISKGRAGSRDEREYGTQSVSKACVSKDELHLANCSSASAHREIIVSSMNIHAIWEIVSGLSVVYSKKRKE